MADECQEGLMCCDVSGQVPGTLPLCLPPGECATLSLKIGCEQGGGSWSGGGCHYPSPEVPEAPPEPVIPGGYVGPPPSGPGPSIPGRVTPPAAKEKPALPGDKKILGVDPLILGAGVVVLGVVGLAVMKKKKKKRGPR
jgi:hypothetical protein